jgi:hypothetical protein
MAEVIKTPPLGPGQPGPAVQATATAAKKGMSLETKKFLVTLLRDACDSYLKMLDAQTNPGAAHAEESK